MRFRVTTGLFVLTLGAIGCGSAPPPPVVTPPPAPPAASPPPPAKAEEKPASRQPALDAALAREASGLTSAESRSSDGAISVTAESSAPPTFEISDRIARILIPVGTAQPIACIVRTDAPATGALIYGLLADAQKAIPKNQIAQLDVGLVGRAPYFLAELQYLVEQDGKQSMGALKAAAFEREDGTLLCVHEELGYRATFRRVTEEIARTMVLRAAGVPAALTDYAVAVAHVGKQAVGYTVERHVTRPDGTHVEVESSSMLLPRTASELASIETAKTVTSDKLGVVVSIRSMRSQNGAPERAVAVERKGAGKYHVEGTVEGAAVKGDFTAQAPLWSTWRARRELHDKVLGGPKLKELTMSDYIAAVDPLKLTKTVWSATDRPDVLETASGPVKVEMTVDAAARPVKSAFKLGAVEVVVERVVTEATPR